MILPLGDSPNPRGVPFVTYALIGLNLAVFVFVSLPLSAVAPDPGDPGLREYLRVVAERHPGVSVREILSQLSAYEIFIYRHGFLPSAPSLSDLFFSLFLHAGLLHLAGNMLFLWIYGDNVEHRLGAPLYLAAYLGTGVAATLFHTLFDPGSNLPLVGASGAISGVLGFYFLWFPRNQVRLFVFLFPILFDVILVPARILLGLYLLMDNLLPFLITRGSGIGGVAYGAHIGGFLAGVAVAWWWDRREVAERPREYARRESGARAAAGPREAIREAIAAGDFPAAAETYFSLPLEATRAILAPADSLALAEWLRENGHDRAALSVYRRHLRDHPRGTGAAEAHLGAGMVQLQLGQAAAAYQHFLDTLDLDPPAEVAARARAFLEEIAPRRQRHGGERRRRWP